MRSAIELLKDAHNYIAHPAADHSFATHEKCEEVRSEIASFLNLDGKRELTFGEKAVGLSFNPGGKQEVNDIKSLSAWVIDELDNQRLKAKAENNGEKIAQFTLAIRAIQEGQMWGVKATTWQY